MPRDVDDDDENNSEQEEEEVKAPTYNYDEVDEETGFKKVDKMIWDLYISAREAHQKEKDKEDGEKEDEPAEDDFDKEGFIASTVESKQLDENRIKMVLRLGLYSGGVNEFNEREGLGCSIYSNFDEYKGGYEQNLKHGKDCLYIYYSQHNSQKSIPPVDLEIVKMKEDEKVKEILAKELNDDLKLQEASDYISTLEPFKKLGPNRVFYVLKYGPYPFYEGSYCKDKKQTVLEPKHVPENTEHPSIELNDKSIMRYKDCSLYIGQFFDGKKHGKGIMYYANGDIYNGEWKNNQKHGVGDYYFASNNSTYKAAHWENGQIKTGTWVMPGGTTYESKNFNQTPANSSGSFLFASKNGKGEKKQIKVEGSFVEDEWQPKAISAQNAFDPEKSFICY
ncbi:predicted protein [Naegleria gruberi]|uniref:Predicted protein n=1 Tax=Naegleria gruberi TaxID=5762 RepID=D2UX44_NAEGR|nr:uncharacterized protein NAEGRDRAFT_56558 [Naegleria gruberi]EFC50869.1 predicted protein [Naegleria gruberi]|eukprot:XP_002683613.1 predicted protein [Naegleria gruberi strain NEG-M]